MKIDSSPRPASIDRLSPSAQKLRRTLHVDHLDGLSVLVIGPTDAEACAAAVELGASRVVAVGMAAGAGWTAEPGAITDPGAPARLGTYDVVIAPRSLDRSGDLWGGLRAATACVAEAGRLFLSVHASEQYADPAPAVWRSVKRRYTEAGGLGRRLMEMGYVWRHCCGGTVGGLLRYPRKASDYAVWRGRPLMDDIREWLSAWPMQFASTFQVVWSGYAECGLELISMSTVEGVSQYLFVRRGQAAALGLEAMSPEKLATLCGVRGLEDLPADRPFHIFGTAAGAQVLYEAWKASPGAPPLAGFIDIAPQAATLHGLPVVTPEDFVKAAPPGTPVLLSNRYTAENSARMAALGVVPVACGLNLIHRLNKILPSHASGLGSPVPGSLDQAIISAIVAHVEDGQEAEMGPQPRNPHFDDDRVEWDDSYSGQYEPVSYAHQFDGQWRLYLKGALGFRDHTGVDTSPPYIDDRIEELTGQRGSLERESLGMLYGPTKLWRGITGADRRRSVGGTLLLEPKFDVDYFRGKQCLDIGCGAGRWTRTLLTLGAKVKSVDVSENGLRSTRRFNDDVERLDLFDIAEKRQDLHSRFDFVICWGVVMCTHDPKLAFENVARTVKPGGSLYTMTYGPTFHSSEFVTTARRTYHRDLHSAVERMRFVYELSQQPENAINVLDALNTFYNWTVDEETIHNWYRAAGFTDIVTLNAREENACAFHVLGRRP